MSCQVRETLCSDVQAILAARSRCRVLRDWQALYVRSSILAHRLLALHESVVQPQEREHLEALVERLLEFAWSVQIAWAPDPGILEAWSVGSIADDLGTLPAEALLPLPPWWLQSNSKRRRNERCRFAASEEAKVATLCDSQGGAGFGKETEGPLDLPLGDEPSDGLDAAPHKALESLSNSSALQSLATRVELMTNPLMQALQSPGPLTQASQEEVAAQLARRRALLEREQREFAEEYAREQELQRNLAEAHAGEWRAHAEERLYSWTLKDEHKNMPTKNLPNANDMTALNSVVDRAATPPPPPLTSTGTKLKPKAKSASLVGKAGRTPGQNENAGINTVRPPTAGRAKTAASAANRLKAPAGKKGGNKALVIDPPEAPAQSLAQALSTFSSVCSRISRDCISVASNDSQQLGSRASPPPPSLSSAMNATNVGLVQDAATESVQRRVRIEALEAMILRIEKEKKAAEEAKAQAANGRNGKNVMGPTKATKNGQGNKKPAIKKGPSKQAVKSQPPNPSYGDLARDGHIAQWHDDLEPYSTSMPFPFQRLNAPAVEPGREPLPPKAKPVAQQSATGGKQAQVALCSASQDEDAAPGSGPLCMLRQTLWSRFALPLAAHTRPCRGFWLYPTTLLLTGPRGVGKASLVRDLARSTKAALLVLPLGMPATPSRSSKPCADLVTEIFQAARHLAPSIIHLEHVERLFLTDKQRSVALAAELGYAEPPCKVQKLVLKEIAALTAQDGVLVISTSSAPQQCLRADAISLKYAFACKLHLECPDHLTRVWMIRAIASSLFKHHSEPFPLGSAALSLLARVTKNLTPLALRGLLSDLAEQRAEEAPIQKEGSEDRGEKSVFETGLSVTWLAAELEALLERHRPVAVEEDQALRACVAWLQELPPPEAASKTKPSAGKASSSTTARRRS